MKIVNKDEDKKAKEQEEKIKRLNKEKDREQYLQRLVSQRKFKEYVIEGIFEKHIKDLTNTKKLFPIGFDILKQRDEAAELLAVSMASEKQLKKILKDLIN